MMKSRACCAACSFMPVFFLTIRVRTCYISIQRAMWHTNNDHVPSPNTTSVRIICVRSKVVLVSPEIGRFGIVDAILKFIPTRVVIKKEPSSPICRNRKRKKEITPGLMTTF